MEIPKADRRLSRTGRRHSPTRERVLRMLEAQPVPTSTAAIATALGLHTNTVRGHLEQLHADGYVHRTRGDAAGRGRPAWMWSAAETNDPQATYAGLATSLARTLATSTHDPLGAARSAGLSWGAEIAADRDRTGTWRDAVVTAMRDQGFDPCERDGDVILRQCPLIEAATAHPEIVCTVHQGLVDGVLRAWGERGRSSLYPFTAPGECTLRLPTSS